MMGAGCQFQDLASLPISRSGHGSPQLSGETKQTGSRMFLFSVRGFQQQGKAYWFNRVFFVTQPCVLPRPFLYLAPEKPKVFTHQKNIVGICTAHHPS